MKLFRTGYIVATIDNYKIFSYSAWPLSTIENDEIAKKITEEADDNWFTLYDMPEIAPSLEYVKRYVAYCHSISIDAVILMLETPLSNFEVNDELKTIKTYGYDCIGPVGYSFLMNERTIFADDFAQNKIVFNEYALFNSLEDVERFIILRQNYIAAGINLEDYWTEMPIRISEVVDKF